MSSTSWLILYCALIVAASLLGGWIPMLMRLTHRGMELAVSFVAGVMLGVGLLHMLPHAVMARSDALAGDQHEHLHGHELAHDLLGPIVLWLLAGFLVMFFIERFFCFHHHDVPREAKSGIAADKNSSVASGHDHGGSGEHASGRVHVHPAHSRHTLTWTGAAIGLGLHSLIEGVALAASVAVGRAGHHGAADGGGAAAVGALGTFLVIVLHKPFDSLTIGTLMSVGHRSALARHATNVAFGLLVPLGVLLFQVGLFQQGDGQLVSAALAFSAGTFMCIAMSDLLPELQFHQHDRVKLSLALLMGLAVAWIVAALESRLH